MKLSRLFVASDNGQWQIWQISNYRRDSDALKTLISAEKQAHYFFVSMDNNAYKYINHTMFYTKSYFYSTVNTVVL